MFSNDILVFILKHLKSFNLFLVHFQKLFQRIFYNLFTFIKILSLNVKRQLRLQIQVFL